ncbi:MAG TPA: pantoate--beta-alanine ligase [Dehalococcoidia bacterium]|nr:pantoate--beta-alanine ligase [Dehalococcoidia bacterium]
MDKGVLRYVRMSVSAIESVAAMEAARNEMGGVVGLVPTMGYLHEGHLSLVRRARADCDTVIVSIFVNPTQFGPGEDLERYPRDTERDLRLLEEAGVDIVFAPPVDEMYPPGFDNWVEVTGPLTERLEGAARPGHFRGVTTVVARLFRIVRPDRAYFGQKDAQQLRVIRRMVQQEGLPVTIVPMPIVREEDGLAMSSRNVYLSAEERSAALALSGALRHARRMVREDGVTDTTFVKLAVHRILQQQPAVQVEYVSVSDEETLEEMTSIDRPAMVLLAAKVGSTRLIDNVVVAPKGMALPEELV